MRLSGKNAIISGASQGLGFEIAKEYVRQGANVVICARNQAQLSAAADELSKHAVNGAKVLSMPVDVSLKNEVDELVRFASEELGVIDILVANAGVYGTKGPIEEVDWDEWSRAIDINLKGTVLQCRAVLSQMKKRKYGKIIVLSGGGATKPMPNLSAYATSKAGVVRFAETLAQEVADFNIDVNTVAPGALNTRLLQEILEAGPEKVGKHFYEQSLKQQQSGGTPLDVGVSLCTFLATPESDGITGRLLSAVWDPWQKLPGLKGELSKSDIYTLRRIVPEERGLSWEVSK